MKTLLIVVLGLTLSFANDYKTFASKMDYNLDYKVALTKAKESKKDIMIVMVANFCPWCVKFEKLILEKEKYDKQIKDNFIPLIINREEGNFPKFLDTPIVPTIYFVDFKSEKIKNKVVGYNNRLDFFNIIEK
ncbi:MAG: thioredoxin family protein [Sulfurovum sp.]|jgi:thioredoxin-related protein